MKGVPVSLSEEGVALMSLFNMNEGGVALVPVRLS